jgi:hypothetical protein
MSLVLLCPCHINFLVNVFAIPIVGGVAPVLQCKFSGRWV